ncbi:short-chain dehydrogenase [Fusarium beomiforme]|uniref:Short-chain dehydrogenase n=1 Tax=Fusarium beomiforme TaxID=44412 RepID=A0A9P5E0V3_9HYPO|nr:short-chain dehydrogenase [Fusarium beomiforme]
MQIRQTWKKRHNIFISSHRNLDPNDLCSASNATAMDPVTGIGLAAAVIQLIEVCVKITKRLVEFSAANLENGPPKSFSQIMTTLPLITQGLQNLHDNLNHVSTQTQNSLCPVIEKCLSDVQELNRIIDKALPSTGASRWERKKKALVSFRYDKKVEQISRAIDKYLEALSFHQLSGIPQSYPSQISAAESSLAQEKTHWLVPFDRNPSFVNRKGIFEEIEKAFTVQEGVQPKAALHGLGGIGKSQIALEYCYRRRSQDPRCTIFWCNAASIARFEQSLNQIAILCGLVSEGKADADAPELVKTWLETQWKGPWLMVIDNIDDRDVLFTQSLKSGKTISDSIPVCSSGSLLFTTRSREVAFDALRQTRPILIKEMDKEEGLELAKKRLDKETPEGLIIKLLELLEYIPLAITQASAFIGKRDKTVQYYLEEYGKSDTTRARLLSYEFSDHGRQANSMESVAKTWIISFESIRQSNQRASEMLCLMSFYQHHGVPTFLLRKADEDEFNFKDAIALLESFAFVNSNESDSALRTHRLVQVATRWWLNEEGPTESDKWELEALTSLKAYFPAFIELSSPNKDHFMMSEILLPHVEQALQIDSTKASADCELSKATLLYSLGYYMFLATNPNKARGLLEQSMELMSKHLGEEHIDTVLCATSLASIYAGLGDAKSIHMLKRLLLVQEKTLGKDDPLTIDVLYRLADAVLLIERNPSKSEEMLRKALIRCQTLPEDDRRFMATISRLSYTCLLQNKYAEAEALSRQAYSLAQRKYGPADLYLLTAEEHLAHILTRRVEAHEEAHEIYLRTISKLRDLLGPDHLQSLRAAGGFSILLKEMGKLEEAKSVCERALNDAENSSRARYFDSEGIIGAHKKLLQSINRLLIEQEKEIAQ